MEIYRCTIHMAYGGTTITSPWNISRYWAKRIALREVKEGKIGHITFETYIVDEGPKIFNKSKCTGRPGN